MHVNADTNLITQLAERLKAFGDETLEDLNHAIAWTQNLEQDGLWRGDSIQEFLGTTNCGYVKEEIHRQLLVPIENVSASLHRMVDALNDYRGVQLP